MQIVKDWFFLALFGGGFLWVLDWVISDAVAKGIKKSGVGTVDIQNQVEEGVRDALETYFKKRRDE